MFNTVSYNPSLESSSPILLENIVDVLKESTLVTLSKFIPEEKRNREESLYQENREKLYGFLSNILLTQKFYQLGEKAYLKQLKDLLFTKPLITDFVLTLRGVFFLQFKISNPSIDLPSLKKALINMVSFAIYLPYEGGENPLYLEQGLLKRLSPLSREELEMILFDNDYLLPLILLNLTLPLSVIGERRSDGDR